MGARMATKRDYYETLGVAREASDDEVKKAFRRLARQLHPDVNTDDPAASERFREVAEAYEVLSDADTRARYDRFGHAGVESAHMRTDEAFQAGNLGDLFAMLFGEDMFGFGGGRAHGPMAGADAAAHTTISLHDAAFGVRAEVEVEVQAPCARCEQSGAEPGTQPTTCPTCGGAGEVRQVVRTVLGQMVRAGTCPECRGRGRLIEHPCRDCRGAGVRPERRQVVVAVPPGIEHGQQIRVRAQGHAGDPGAPPGDLYVAVAVEEDPRFERAGRDLVTVVELTMTQAALGATHRRPDARRHRVARVQAGHAARRGAAAEGPGDAGHPLRPARRPAGARERDRAARPVRRSAQARPAARRRAGAGQLRRANATRASSAGCAASAVAEPEPELVRWTVRVAAADLEEALARMLDAFPDGVTEELEGDEVVLAGYLPAGRTPAVDAVPEPVEPGWREAWRAFHRPVVVGPFWVGPPWLRAGSRARCDRDRARPRVRHRARTARPGPRSSCWCAIPSRAGCCSTSAAARACSRSPPRGSGMRRCRRSTATRTPSQATVANARDNGAEVTAWEADALADERARGRRCSSRTSSSSCSSRCSRAASPGRA